MVAFRRGTLRGWNLRHSFRTRVSPGQHNRPVSYPVLALITSISRTTQRLNLDSLFHILEPFAHSRSSPTKCDKRTNVRPTYTGRTLVYATPPCVLYLHYSFVKKKENTNLSILFSLAKPEKCFLWIFYFKFPLNLRGKSNGKRLSTLVPFTLKKNILLWQDNVKEGYSFWWLEITFFSVQEERVFRILNRTWRH